MAKRSAGERVLESKHVIGLFLLMLVFSGVFFTLGYVMGRNQYDGQVRAASTGVTTAEVPPARNASKKGGPELAPAEVDSDPATASSSGWDFYGSGKPANAEPRLESPRPPAPKPAAPVASPKSNSAVRDPAPAPAAVAPPKNPRGTSLIPSDALLLQVAALKRQDDALAIASSLQKKHYAAYVQPPSKDKYYRV